MVLFFRRRHICQYDIRTRQKTALDSEGPEWDEIAKENERLDVRLAHYSSESCNDSESY